MSSRIGPERILVVDGYNVLNARRHIEGSAALADARDALVHELQDYAGFSGQTVVVVFDAWQGDRHMRSVEKQGPVTVVFTQKGETADHYIERLCDGYAEEIEYRRVEIRVATSDALEQTIILGRGATRISSRELLMEMKQVRAGSATGKAAAPSKGKTTLEDILPADVVKRMKEMARGK